MKTRFLNASYASVIVRLEPRISNTMTRQIHDSNRKHRYPGLIRPPRP